MKKKLFAAAQGATQRMNENKSRTRIEKHAANTIQKGKDLFGGTEQDKGFMSSNQGENMVKMNDCEQYESKYLQVSEKLVSGWLRRTAIEENSSFSQLFSASPYPLYFFVLKRGRGTIYVFEKPGEKLICRLDQAQILYAKINHRYDNGGTVDSSLDSQQIPQSGASTQRDSHPLPSDFQYQLDLVCDDARLHLWANSEKERLVWVTHLQKHCVVRDAAYFNMYANKQSKLLVDPSDDNPYDNRPSMPVLPGLIGKGLLMKYTPDYLEYMLENFHVYLSDSLRSQPQKTICQVQKMSSNKMSNQTGIKLFLYRKLEINFADERVHLSAPSNKGDISARGTDTSPRPKSPIVAANKNGNSIFFDQLISASQKDLCLESFQSKPDYKFQVHVVTTEREYALFTRTKKERSVLVKELLRAIESQNVQHQNLRKGAVKKSESQKGFESNTSTAAQREQIYAFEHRAMPRKTIKTKFADGFQGYRSPTMYVSHIQVNGHVKKMVENPKFYHKELYHKRIFMLDFSQATLFIFKGESASTPQKQIDLKNIVAVEAYDPQQKKSDPQQVEEPEPQEEEPAKGGQKQPAKKMSLYNMFSKAGLTKPVPQPVKNPPKKSCNWLFGMKMVTYDRTYTLFVPTKDDLAQWLRVLKLITGMNGAQISFKSKNPFTYELEQRHLKEQEDLKTHNSLSSHNSLRSHHYSQSSSQLSRQPAPLMQSKSQMLIPEQRQQMGIMLEQKRASKQEGFSKQMPKETVKQMIVQENKSAIVEITKKQAELERMKIEMLKQQKIRNEEIRPTERQTEYSEEEEEEEITQPPVQIKGQAVLAGQSEHKRQQQSVQLSVGSESMPKKAQAIKRSLAQSEIAPMNKHVVSGDMITNSNSTTNNTFNLQNCQVGQIVVQIHNSSSGESKDIVPSPKMTITSVQSFQCEKQPQDSPTIVPPQLTKLNRKPQVSQNTAAPPSKQREPKAPMQSPMVLTQKQILMNNEEKLTELSSNPIRQSKFVQKRRNEQFKQQNFCVQTTEVIPNVVTPVQNLMCESFTVEESTNPWIANKSKSVMDLHKKTPIVQRQNNFVMSPKQDRVPATNYNSRNQIFPQKVSSTFQVSNNVMQQKLPAFIQDENSFDTSRKSVLTSKSCTSLTKHGRKFKVREPSNETCEGTVIGIGQIVRTKSQSKLSQLLQASGSQPSVTPRKTSIKLVKLGATGSDNGGTTARDGSGQLRSSIVITGVSAPDFSQQDEVITKAQREELRQKFAKIRAKQYVQKKNGKTTLSTFQKSRHQHLGSQLTTTDAQYQQAANGLQIPQRSVTPAEPELHKQILQSAFYGKQMVTETPTPRLQNCKTTVNLMQQFPSAVSNLIGKKLSKNTRNANVQQEYVFESKGNSDQHDFSFDHGSKAEEQDAVPYGVPDKPSRRRLVTELPKKMNSSPIDSINPSPSKQQANTRGKSRNKQDTAQFGDGKLTGFIGSTVKKSDQKASKFSSYHKEQESSFETVWD